MKWFIFKICGGLATYFDINSSRLIYFEFVFHSIPFHSIPGHLARFLRGKQDRIRSSRTFFSHINVFVILQENILQELFKYSNMQTTNSYVIGTMIINIWEKSVSVGFYDSIPFPFQAMARYFELCCVGTIYNTAVPQNMEKEI